ncbi:GIY-YIG nuclease family protein [Ruegeria atlantica]|uniref:GIY-YIG nuclease family protein n=1 Tax=Ruegeria atlantica TaxID=81569 RepID=UPI0024944D7B|nr:GIY-YIG nuclease family protein [Ruegeria atlantica]
MKRVIYVLKNSADPSVVKVGMSDNLHRRVGQMNSLSSTVGEWSPLESFEMVDHISLEEAEQAALNALNEYKVPSRREQFRIEYNKAIRDVRGALFSFQMSQLTEILKQIEPGSIVPDSAEGCAGVELMGVIFKRLQDEQGIISEFGEEGTDEMRERLEFLTELSGDQAG